MAYSRNKKDRNWIAF